MTYSGGKPHAVGDKGQRYEVRFLGWHEHPDEEKVLGWAGDLAGARDFVRGIDVHPVWHSPRIVDRQELPWGWFVDGVPPLEIAKRLRRLKIDAEAKPGAMTHVAFCDLVDAAASLIECERDEAANQERERVRGWLLHLAMLCVEGSPRYATLIELANDVARGVHRITPR